MLRLNPYLISKKKIGSIKNWSKNVKSTREFITYKVAPEDVFKKTVKKEVIKYIDKEKLKELNERIDEIEKTKNDSEFREKIFYLKQFITKINERINEKTVKRTLNLMDIYYKKNYSLMKKEIEYHKKNGKNPENIKVSGYSSLLYSLGDVTDDFKGIIRHFKKTDSINKKNADRIFDSAYKDFWEHLDVRIIDVFRLSYHLVMNEIKEGNIYDFIRKSNIKKAKEMIFLNQSMSLRKIRPIKQKGI